MIIQNAHFNIKLILVFVSFLLKVTKQQTVDNFAQYQGMEATAMDIYYPSSTVFIANINQQIVEFPFVTGSALKTIQTGHKATISSLSVSPNKKFILTGGSDYTARIFGYTLGDQVCLFDQLRGQIISAKIADDNDFWAVSSSEGYMYYGYISNCSKSIYNKTNFIMSGLQIVRSRNQIWIADGNTMVIVFNYQTQTASGFTMPTSNVVSILALSGTIGVCTARAFYILDYSGSITYTINNPSVFTSSCRVYFSSSTLFFLLAIHEATSLSTGNIILWNIWKIDLQSSVSYLYLQQQNTLSRYGTGRVCKDAGILYLDSQVVRVASIARTTNPLYNVFGFTGGSCGTGFFVNSVCQKCNWDSSRAYCTACNPSQCQQCAIYTYINSTSTKNCIPCPTNCYTCSSAATCTSCIGGFTLISGSCLPSNLTGCVYSYPYTQSSITVSKCYQCQIGYFPQNDLKCKLCTQVYANCSECTTTGCYKCSPNFFLAPSTNCQICSHAIQGCAACLNQTYCDTCYEQFPYYSLPSVGARICIKNCNPTCLTCDRDSVQTCRSCPVNRTLITPANTCQCKPQFPIQDPITYICQECTDFLSNCLNCTSKTYCTKCDVNYYFQDTNATVQTCQTCNYTCLTCNVTWYKCQTCDALANRVRDPISGRCNCSSIRHFQLGTQVACQLCSNHITNCDVCYNQSFCVTCNSGYFVNTTGVGTNVCSQCSAPCTQCYNVSTNCTNCGAGRKLNPTVGKCDCLDGYFSIGPTTCAPCSPLLGSCLKCVTATTCDQCWDNNYFVMVNGSKMCDLCQSTCLTCDVFTNICKTCDPLANRVFNIITKQCDCVVGYTETNGRCLNCTATFQFCTACTAIRCLSCQPGYSLGFGGLKCVDCAQTYPGCIQCLNGLCAACNLTAGYELSYSKCICQPGYYRKQLQCLPYAMGPPTQRLYPTYPVYYQDMNTSIIMIMIYFQCESLKLPYGISNSVTLYMNDQPFSEYTVTQMNTTLIFSFLPKKDSSFTKIEVQITNKTFYDHDEYGAKQKSFVYIKNVYKNSKYELSSGFSWVYEKYLIPAIRWLTTILLILGCADLVLLLVFTVHFIPGFLLLNITAPLPLQNMLQTMVKINYQSLFAFSEVKTGYIGYGEAYQQSYMQTYGLTGGLVHRKATDLVFLGCILLFYGVICPKLTPHIPQGKLKKLWVHKFQLKIYSTLSNTILCILPSFLFCCVLDFRMLKFYPDSFATIAISYILLAVSSIYIFVHSMILYNTQFSDTYKNQDCYFGSSILQPKSIPYILSLLVIGIWTVPMLGILKGIASLPILICVLLWNIWHFRYWDNFPLKILYFLKLGYSLSLLFFMISYLVFVVGQNYSPIQISTLQLLGLIDLVIIIILFAISSLQTLFLFFYAFYKACKQSANIVENIQDEKQKAELEQQYSNQASTVYNMKIINADGKNQSGYRDTQQQQFNAKLTNKQQHMKKFKEQHMKTMGSSMYKGPQDSFNKTGMSSVSKKAK